MTYSHLEGNFFWRGGGNCPKEPQGVERDFDCEARLGFLSRSRWKCKSHGLCWNVYCTSCLCISYILWWVSFQTISKIFAVGTEEKARSTNMFSVFLAVGWFGSERNHGFSAVPGQKSIPGTHTADTCVSLTSGTIGMGRPGWWPMLFWFCGGTGPGSDQDHFLPAAHGPKILRPHHDVGVWSWTLRTTLHCWNAGRNLVPMHSTT